MRIAHFTALRQIEIAEAPEPKLDRPDHVLLRIDRVGICGSDVHYYQEGGIGDQIVQYPATLGHECAGTVVEVGADVKTLRPGDRVAVDPALVCGECDQCRADRSNTCRHIQFMGTPGEAPGAVADYHVLPAQNCLPIPDSMSLDEAVLAEPLSIGLYAVRGAGFQLVKAGQASRNLAPRTVAVLGAGPIGLSVILCAKAAGPRTIYATDLLDERLGAARGCGADWTGKASPGDDFQAGVMTEIARLEPRGVDVAFECSGDPACIDQAQRLLTPGGALVMVGIPAVTQVSFDPHRMRRAELTFMAVRRQKGCVAPVIQMIGARQIDPSPMLTHHFPLSEIREAFELVAGYRDGVIKAILNLTSAK